MAWRAADGKLAQPRVFVVQMGSPGPTIQRSTNRARGPSGFSVEGCGETAFRPGLESVSRKSMVPGCCLYLTGKECRRYSLPKGRTRFAI